MKDILVTVIICVFNTPIEYFSDAINSIVNQTYRNLEIFIIDDGSTNFPYVPQLKDERIRVIHNNQNKGIAYSRNVGLSLAKGKYIAIMDSDDIAELNRIQEQVDFMEKNQNVVSCGSWFRQFGAKDSLCRRNFKNNDIYKALLLFGNSPTLLDPSSMHRKASLDSINFKYDEDLKLGLDFMMWVRMTECGDVKNVSKILMNYRVHSKQITKTYSKSEYNWKVIKYQLNKIKFNYDSKEKSMFLNDLSSTSYSLKDYRLLLDKIMSCNSKNKYFEENALKKVCEYKWHLKLLHSKNLCYLFSGFKNLKNERKTIIKNFLRHFGLFRKMDCEFNEYYGK